MNEQTINQIKELLAPIGEKIGQGAEFGWEIVVKQQMVVAVLGLFWIIAGLILSYFVHKAVKKMKSIGKYDDLNIPLALFVGFGVVASIIMICAGTTDALTHFINPEYYAIEFFIGLVK